MNKDFKQRLEQSAQRVDKKLLQHLPSQDKEPIELHQAMAYSTFNGGKRIRPFLVYSTGKALGIDEEKLDYVKPRDR